MPIPVRPPIPPTEILRRGEARLLACLPGLADATDDPTLSAPAVARAPEDVVSAADRYAFGPVFATGGLGVIRRGEDRRLGRTIAIKELLRDSPQAQQRFALEAAITARLQHPGIVPLYDLGWQDGKPYYCMKLVDGESLEARIARAQGLAERLRLVEHVVAVADAIAYAHEQRVVHRDLKPANVLVGRFGETVVIDWGLAKDLGGQASSEPRAADEPDALPGVSDMTEAGTVMGTLRYMPPEQAAGEPVDARSDVYALGAMLHHVLAGAPPFAAVHGPALVRAVLAGEVEALTEAPRGLAAIARRAMARDPAARYASAAAFAEDLRRFLAGRLVSAHAYSAGEVVRLWVRRHRTAVVVGSTLVAALAATGIFAARRVGEAREATALAERTSAAAAERADRAAFERAALAAAERAGEVLRLARTPGREREALALGVRVLADAEAPPRAAVDGVAEALSTMLPLATLSSADHPVHALTFSPDGALLATYPRTTAPGQDRIKIWSTARAAVVTTLPAGDNPFGTMVFAPDGRRLAVSGEERCGVWDLADASQLDALPGCALPFYAPDGATLYGKVPGALVGGSRLYTGLAAWDAGAAAPRWTTEIPGDNFVALAHPDGQRLIVKRDHHSGEVVDVLAAADGRRLATLDAGRRPTRYGPRSAGFVLSDSLALAPGGRWLAVAEAADDGRLRLWDLERGGHRDLGVEDATYHALLFAGDDRLVTHGAGLATYATATGERTLALPGSWMATALGGSALATDGSALLRMTTGMTHQALPPGRVWQLTASPDGQYVAAILGPEARLWSARDHLAVARWTPPAGHTVVSFAADAAVTRDDRGALWVHDREAAAPPLALATDASAEQSEARAWRVPGGVWREVHTVVDAAGVRRTVRRLRLHDARTGAERLAHDDASDGFWPTAAAARAAPRLAAAVAGAIVVRDASDGRTLCSFAGAGADLEALTISDDGAWVAALDRAGALGLWSVATCARRASLQALTAAEARDPRYLRSFAVSDRGQALLRYRDRTIVQAADAAAWTVQDPCRPSQPWGYSRLSPDGATLLSSCESAQSHERGWLWDVGGARRAELELGGYVDAPAFTPDGDRLVFRTTQGRLAVLDAATGAAVTTVRGQTSVEAFAVRADGQIDALAGSASAGEFAAACGPG